MAHIPYGYEIVDGKAVLKAGEAGKVKLLYRYYLDGYAIQTSGERAGIQLSISTIGHILKNPVYRGDHYYPQIIDDETWCRAQEERQSRYERMGCFTSNNAVPAAKTRDLFRLVPESVMEWEAWPQKAKEAMNKPAKKAAYIYTRVIADRHGKKKMSSAEQLTMIEWITDHIEQSSSQTGQG